MDNIGHLDPDSKSKNKKNSKHKECYEVTTATGTQCHHDEFMSMYGSNPPNSIVVGLILSPTIYKVKYNNYK